MTGAQRVKITFAEMRGAGITQIEIFCANPKCGHYRRLDADRFKDHVRLSDIEPKCVCAHCGHKGADIRPAKLYKKGA